MLLLHHIQALNATDKGLAIQPENGQLLKLKGDILKDLKNMSAAEKVIVNLLLVPQK